MTFQLRSHSLEAIKAMMPLHAAIRKRDAKLADQLRRASQSMHLNIAEAQGVRDGNRRLRFLTAFGSCQETMAALELAQVFGYTEGSSDALGRFDRVAAKLYRLTS